jgi:hypothetical protein
MRASRSGSSRLTTQVQVGPRMWGRLCGPCYRGFWHSPLQLLAWTNLGCHGSAGNGSSGRATSLAPVFCTAQLASHHIERLNRYFTDKAFSSHLRPTLTCLGPSPSRWTLSSRLGIISTTLLSKRPERQTLRLSFESRKLRTLVSRSIFESRQEQSCRP